MSSSVHNGRASVTFRIDDGSEQTIKADHVISATGFKVDMRRLRFIGSTIMDKLKCAQSTPVVSPHFETSVPGLFMVGIAAANNFGPLLRFAYGAGYASRRLSRHLIRTASRQPAAATEELVTA
jgi:thioredoxin reductase